MLRVSENIFPLDSSSIDPPSAHHINLIDAESEGKNIRHLVWSFHLTKSGDTLLPLLLCNRSVYQVPITITRGEEDRVFNVLPYSGE
jgi:hypothetical protein